MSTAELMIAQAIDHFNGNTSHVKREEVLIQRLYRLLLLDPEVNSCSALTISQKKFPDEFVRKFQVIPERNVPLRVDVNTENPFMMMRWKPGHSVSYLVVNVAVHLDAPRYVKF